MNDIGRSFESADGADHLADLTVEVEVCPDGKGDAAVIPGDELAPVQLPLDLVVLAQMLDDAHLGRLLGLDEARGISPCHLGQRLLRDHAQVVVVVQKSSIHS